MNPRSIADKLFQELCGCDGSAPSGTYVFTVRDVTLQKWLKMLVHRHRPEELTCRSRSPGNAITQFSTVGEYSCDFLSQGNNTGSGQRRQINDRVGTVVNRVTQHVRQHQPPLGVRVMNFDGGAVSSGHNITQTIGAATDHVLHEAQVHRKIHRQLQSCDRADHSQRRRRAGHVGLHRDHAVTWLDRVATAVERNAFTDKRHCLSVAVSASVGQLHDSRRLLAASSHRQQRAHFLRRQVRFIQNDTLQIAVFRDLSGARGKGLRKDVIG